MDLLSTALAARALGISRARVIQLIHGGIVRAQRVGRDYVIDRAALAAARKRPGPGWVKGRRRKPENCR